MNKVLGFAAMSLILVGGGLWHFKGFVGNRHETLVKELTNDFSQMRVQAYQVYLSKDQNGKVWWNQQKPWIIKKYGKGPIQGAQWKHPALTQGFDPDDKSQDFDAQKNATPYHFLNQIKRIPLQQPPTAQRILQVALNIGQGMAAGSVKQAYELKDFIQFE